MALMALMALMVQMACPELMVLRALMVLTVQMACQVPTVLPVRPELTGLDLPEAVTLKVLVKSPLLVTTVWAL